MSPVTRLATFAAVVVLCTGVLGYRILSEELNRSGAGVTARTLDEELGLLKDCAARKERIAEQLAAGRITLVDAASQVGDLNLPRHFWKMLPISDPARTTEESLCRHIIEIAVTQVADSAQAQALQRRLEKELEDAADSQGRMVLPSRRLVPLFDAHAIQVSVD